MQKMRRILRKQHGETGAKGHGADFWQASFYLVFSNMQPLLCFSKDTSADQKTKWKQDNKEVY